MDFTRAAILVVLASAGSIAGCRTDKKGRESHIEPEAYQNKHREALLEAHSDDHRWTIEWPRWGATEVLARKRMKEAFLYNILAGDLWNRSFRGVVRFLEMSPGDLLVVGNRIGIEEHFLRDLPMGENGRAYEMLESSTGEIARDWIENLTGKRFSTRDEFLTWFTMNGDRLLWNARSGRFEDQPTTLPEAERI